MSEAPIGRVPLALGWTLWSEAQLRAAGFSTALLAPFGGAVEDEYRALYRLAAAPRFRCAVWWQNPEAVMLGLDAWLRHPPGELNARLRKKALLVLRYLQRYTCKCDTIGFFGPIGWAALGDVEQVPDALFQLGRRRVFFEPWAVRTLARALGRHGAPRRDPRHWCEAGGRVFGVAGARGKDWSVARAPLAPAPLVADDDAPEAALADLPAMQELMALKDAVAAVAVDDDRALAGALTALNERFSALTGASSKRGAGRTYAGRQIIYEDCQRAGVLAVSAARISALGPALALLLHSARWLTAEIARGFLARARAELSLLCGPLRRRVNLSLLWQSLAPELDSDACPFAVAAERELRARWWQVFSAPSGARVQFSAAALEDAVTRLFAAQAPGWPGARHHAPDLMFCRDGHAVLGELHVGMHPWATLSATRQHPAPARLIAAYAEDIDRIAMAPIPDNDFARSSHDLHLSPGDWHLDTGSQAASSRRVFRVSDFSVCEADGTLVAETKDGAVRFALTQIFERPLKMQAVGRFGLVPAECLHAPRIDLDGLTVSRQRWQLSDGDLRFCLAEDGVERYELFLQLARARLLPRWLFVRAPHEVKPLFVDAKSPLFVEMLCRLARQSAVLSVTEMLPALDALSLRDARGDAYVTELRLIAVDPVAWEER